MTARSRRLTFSPLADEDIAEELRYLYEVAGEAVAVGYLSSVDRTLEYLRSMPYLGRSCGFATQRFKAVRRLPISAPYDKRLVFYTPSDTEVRVERIIHSAQDWKRLFR
jgi:plasmid stabilization system protein ParE